MLYIGFSQIYKHIPEPKAGYVADWDELPNWQQETDADIFERIELEYMGDGEVAGLRSVPVMLAIRNEDTSVDLQHLSNAAFSDELDRRIDRVDEAWKAGRGAFGIHLEGLTFPNPPTTAEEHHKLWAEMEESERSLKEAWRELYRRKDLRLGR